MRRNVRESQGAWRYIGHWFLNLTASHEDQPKKDGYETFYQNYPVTMNLRSNKNTAIRSSYKRGRSHLFMGAWLVNLRGCMIIFDT